LLAVFACLSVFLIDATSAFTTIPTVIVYPLAGSSATLDREASSRIATMLATQIAQGGQVKVIAPKPDVERANYLADARAQGANFYVTGFITPLGAGASVVEQVVSTTSGTLVFSVSNFVSSYPEINAQGDQLRQGIIERASRGVAAFTAPPPPAATPEPEPSKGAGFNVSTLFGGKKKLSATEAAAIAPPANATVVILTPGGSADGDARANTARALALSFQQAGRKAVVVTTGSPANDLCSANKAVAQVGSWVDIDNAGLAMAGTSAQLRVVAYDCSGTIVFDRTLHYGESGGTVTAVSTMAVDAVTSYLAPPKRR
jgi:hypothetical protein